MVGFSIPDWAGTKLDLAAWPRRQVPVIRSAEREEPEEGFASQHRRDRLAGSSGLANLSEDLEVTDEGHAGECWKSQKREIP